MRRDCVALFFYAPDNRMMKLLLIFLILLPSWAFSGVVGISNYPVGENKNVVTAETTGYFNRHREVGGGARYTRFFESGESLDLYGTFAPESRNQILGLGYDIQLAEEKDQTPRFSVKPFYQFKHVDNGQSSTLGAAPMIRKGFSIEGVDFYPYMSLPMGMKIDNSSDNFLYTCSLSLGTSMPLPDKNFFVSAEANKNFSQAYDFMNLSISWIWN
jgi:hypothetical protein